MQFPHIDILIISYNSEKWIDGCFKALTKLNYPLECLHIYIADNNSSDNSVKQTQLALQSTEMDYKIIESKKNLGFGGANNLAAKAGNSPYLFCLNFDTQIEADCLMNFAQFLENNSIEKVGAFEFRQTPNEHPKLYHPATLSTSWCSAAALIIKRSVFEEVKGFDPQIFMYCEDLDLSWRIRSKGYELKYLHFCKVVHHTETNHYGEEIKIINGIIGNLLLRYRYGGLGVILRGYYQVFKSVADKHFKKYKYPLLKAFVKHFKEAPYFIKTRVKFQHVQFYNWDYEIHRYANGPQLNNLENQPLVSVIIRTYKRPEILKEAIQSVLYQTYDNFEVIVVEDGGYDSQKMVESFVDRRVTYHTTVENKGRSNAGNFGLNLANGVYCTFLDDDDFVFHHHISSLVKHMQLSNADATYALALEAKTTIDQNNWQKYNIDSYRLNLFHDFSRLDMTYMNYMPIQTVMFKKELFQKYGGFDETLDYLEDWDLWYRYSFNSDFRMLPKVTSIYKVPSNPQVKEERQKLLDENYQLIKSRYQAQNLEFFGPHLEQHHVEINKYRMSRISLMQLLNYKFEAVGVKKKVLMLPFMSIIKLFNKILKI